MTFCEIASRSSWRFREWAVETRRFLNSGGIVLTRVLYSRVPVDAVTLHQQIRDVICIVLEVPYLLFLDLWK